MAWSLDAALIAPFAVLLAWPLIAAPARASASGAQALLQQLGRAMGVAIVDGVPPVQLGLAVIHDPQLQTAAMALRASAWSSAWPLLLGFVMLGALYHVACECSPLQAGIGKRLLGLRACDRDGRPLGIGHALVRYVAGGLSWATLNLGHLMAAVPPRHLALHDRCSATRVAMRRSTAAGMPGLAWAWLAALGVAGLGGAAWLASLASSIMQVALEQVLFR